MMCHLIRINEDFLILLFLSFLWVNCLRCPLSPFPLGPWLPYVAWDVPGCRCLNTWECNLCNAHISHIAGHIEFRTLGKMVQSARSIFLSPPSPTYLSLSPSPSLPLSLSLSVTVTGVQYYCRSVVCRGLWVRDGVCCVGTLQPLGSPPLQRNPHC